jgi:hypothetical protein
MTKQIVWGAVSVLVLTSVAQADSISFQTFVTAGNIAGAESGSVEDNGTSSAIAFNYAGDKFVGSIYYDNQLYQTDLTGGTVTKFGAPLPDASSAVGEPVVGASLGLGGFATGDVFAGSSANTNIYHYSNSGTYLGTFVTLPSIAGDIRQIFFDPGSSFGGDMIVTTSTGRIYTVSSTGSYSLLASVGEDTEGMDIADSAWGPYAGDLLVSSEASGTIRLVSPGGVVTVVLNYGDFYAAETVSFIPLTLNGLDPLQGFYVANYNQNVQFAPALQFVTQGLLGDAIVTSEDGGSLAWDVHYTGSGFTQTAFTFTGNSIQQFEDGIFVSPQRINDVAAPEPATFVSIGAVLLLAGFRRKRMRGATR